jgi:1,4-alpha-glucan branching enzyme
MSTKDKTKQSDTGCGSQCVCLERTHATAQKACIAGSFNDWHPDVTPMIRLSNGKWAKELAMLPGGHEYRFVVDGEWVDDPSATKRVPNAFGTANAVLEVHPAAPARAGAAARADIPSKKTTGNLPFFRGQQPSAAYQQV